MALSRIFAAGGVDVLAIGARFLAVAFPSCSAALVIQWQQFVGVAGSVAIASATGLATYAAYGCATVRLPARPGGGRVLQGSAEALCFPPAALLGMTVAPPTVVHLTGVGGIGVTPVLLPAAWGPQLPMILPVDRQQPADRGPVVAARRAGWTSFPCSATRANGKGSNGAPNNLLAHGRDLLPCGMFVRSLVALLSADRPYVDEHLPAAPGVLDFGRAQDDRQGAAVLAEIIAVTTEGIEKDCV